MVQKNSPKKLTKYGQLNMVGTSSKTRCNEFIDKVRNKHAHLSILGSGYVGLPTAALFAKAGFQVLAIDAKPDIVKCVSNGNSPLNELGLQELVRSTVESGKLKATLNSDANLDSTDAIIISVQTPIDQHHKPNLSFLLNAATFSGMNLKAGMLVTICSTVPPRTLQGKIKPLLERLSGLRADDDFFLAFVPERIAPGKALSEFVESPRLVGGIGPNSTKAAAELFKTVCQRIIETDATTAEIAKTTENTFRDINIAFANQLALICEQHGADVTKVIELANTHPRVNVHLPGPGVGGPCLTKDPYLLIDGIAFEDKINLIKISREINNSMPNHVIDLIVKGLMNSKKFVKNSRVAVLGTAYKSNVDDPRCSPSEPLIKRLIELGAEVVVFDPYCVTNFGGETKNSINKAVEQSDCIVLMTDHTEFKKIELPTIKKLMNTNPIIVDTRRILDSAEVKKQGFLYYAIGFNNQ